MVVGGVGGVGGLGEEEEDALEKAIEEETREAGRVERDGTVEGAGGRSRCGRTAATPATACA